MSKTQQRKDSMRREGYIDGLRGNPVKWERHPLKAEYDWGYRSGQAYRKSSTARHRSIIQRIVDFFAGRKNAGNT